MTTPGIYDRDLDRNPANFAPMTPLDFLARSAEVYPNRLAVVHGELRRTWREHEARCRQLASALSRRGIGRGDTVAVMLPNTPPMLEAHFGVPMAGAVLNAINTRLDAATIARLTGPNVAKRFGLEGRKGSIAVGCDADLLLLNPRKEHRVTLEELLTRHRLSPYAGRTFPVSVHTVWVRGQTAWSTDSGRGASRGRLVEGVRVL